MKRVSNLWKLIPFCTDADKYCSIIKKQPNKKGLGGLFSKDARREVHDYRITLCKPLYYLKNIYQVDLACNSCGRHKIVQVSKGDLERLGVNVSEQFPLGTFKEEVEQMEKEIIKDLVKESTTKKSVGGCTIFYVPFRKKDQK